MSVDDAGREFKMRDVPSCGVNQLASTLERDRELRSQLDKFLDVVEGRNAHDSVRMVKLSDTHQSLLLSKLIVNLRRECVEYLTILSVS